MYLKKNSVMDKDVWKALRREIFLCQSPTLYKISRNKKEIIFWIRSTTQKLLPHKIYRWLRAKWLGRKYGPLWVRYGSLRRVTPICRDWGIERGLPIDRYYVENFLADNSFNIKDYVLEIGDDYYTRKYGGNRVIKRDVLNLYEDAPQTTIVGDLTDANHIPANTYDCFILTQTLQLIYDVRSALKTAYRILKPGGVLLATIPGISHFDDKEWGKHWCWNFSSYSARRLFEEVFPSSNVKIETYGNVLVAISFLHGLAVEDLRKEELDYHDPGYEFLITVKAVK